MSTLFIGLMSGTSMDGVDAVVVDLDGPLPRVLGCLNHPIPAQLRQQLEDVCRSAAEQPLGQVARLDVAVGELFARAANQLLEAAGLDPAEVRAIGSHGQTVLHQPTDPYPHSIQLGDPNVIAERTGITTVADFRRRDLAAGGQGAPLAPAFHAAVLADPSEARAVLNLGGIANLTVLAPDRPVTGFDTGPANGLLDAWARRHLAAPMDEHGAWARQGQVDQLLLQRLLDDAYFQRPPPKSTGREYFNLAWLEERLKGSATEPRDVQATLVELTVVSVARAAAEALPNRPARLLVCGGGVHNRYLLERLQSQLPDWALQSTAEFGVDPDQLEAIAFAWLAQRTLTGEPGNLPAVTGARHPAVLGAIFQA